MVPYAGSVVAESFEGHDVARILRERPQARERYRTPHSRTPLRVVLEMDMVGLPDDIEHRAIVSIEETVKARSCSFSVVQIPGS